MNTVVPFVCESGPFPGGTRTWKYRLKLTYIIVTSVRPEKDIFSEFVLLSKDGTLTIRSGYAWDGASRPAINTKNFRRGSCVHDALYQLMRENLLPKKWRDEADKELVRITREDGMCRIRCAWVYAGVRAGGWRHV